MQGQSNAATYTEACPTEEASNRQRQGEHIHAVCTHIVIHTLRKYHEGSSKPFSSLQQIPWAAVKDSCLIYSSTCLSISTVDGKWGFQLPKAIDWKSNLTLDASLLGLKLE